MASGSRSGYAVTLARAIEREQARRDGDYDKADAIRKELATWGVRFDDASHTVTTAEGHRGSYSLQKGFGFQEVQTMCLEREEARRENKYTEADQIRQQILSYGVTLDDKTHIFYMSDGTQGSYDLYQGGARAMPAAIQQPNGAPRALNTLALGRPNPGVQVAIRQAPAPPAVRPAPQPVAMVTRAPQYSPAAAAPVPMLGGNSRAQGGGGFDGKFHGYMDALTMAMEREELRKNRDYAGADRMRALLQQRGVAVNDATHIFVYGGLEGTYDLNVGVTAREVQYIALEREEARKNRDYPRGDALREWLARNNVTLDDKTHIFTMATGQAGSYDLYSWTPVGESAPVEPPVEPPLKQQRT